MFEFILNDPPDDEGDVTCCEASYRLMEEALDIFGNLRFSNPELSRHETFPGTWLGSHTYDGQIRVQMYVGHDLWQALTPEGELWLRLHTPAEAQLPCVPTSRR